MMNSDSNLRVRLAALTLAAFTLLASGCGSVQVQRGKNLADAGVLYSQATEQLAAAANDAMIDADSEGLVRSKLPAAAPKDETVLKGRLDDLDSALVENTKMFMTLQASLSANEAYFAALQTLVNNPQSDATATAVSGIADHVNALNNVIKQKGAGPVKPVLSDEQKTAISGLAKLVADQVHGAMVAAALRRDAPVIAEALAYQAQIVDFSGTIIAGALGDKNRVFFVDNVQRPYVKQDIGADWVSDRNTYIKSEAMAQVSKEMKAARDAAKQMSLTWQKILSGVYDTSEMSAQIAEIEALTVALVKVKKAEKPKAPAQ